MLIVLLYHVLYYTGQYLQYLVLVLLVTLFPSIALYSPPRNTTILAGVVSVQTTFMGADLFIFALLYLVSLGYRTVKTAEPVYNNKGEV